MSRLALVVASLLATLVAGAAVAQCPSEGDCRKPHATPGCVMPECCGIVCEANPLCCEVVWDQGCADAAIDACDGISCPSEGDCLAPHPTAGCADYTCCEFVTGIDGWCTWASWDELCARLAEQLCGAGQCAVDATGAIDENEHCYDRVNDGCGLGIVSGRIDFVGGVDMTGRITSGGSRDVDWFNLDGAARRRYRLVVDAEFPLELQYFRGDCEGPNEVKWLVARAVCSAPLALNFIADAGASSLLVGAGNLDGPMRNGLDCDENDPDNPWPPDAPPPVQLFGVRWRARFDSLPIGDIDGNGSVGAPDIAALLNAWGAVPIASSADPRAPDADLDGDGVVGAPDIAILLGSW